MKRNQVREGSCAAGILRCKVKLILGQIIIIRPTKKTTMKNLFNYYMLFVGIASSFIPYIQAYKIFYLKRSKGVSFLASLFSFFTVASWLVYGIVLHNNLLIVSNIMALMSALIVLVTILKYRKTDENV